MHPRTLMISFAVFIIVIFGINGKAKAQISVTVTTDIPGLSFHAEDIAKYLEMIKQMESQVKQLETTYKSLTGSSGIGSLFDNSSLKSLLPSDWQNVYESVSNGGYSGISGTVSSIISSEKSKVSGTLPDALSSLESRMSQKAAYDKSLGESAYKSALQRLDSIEKMIQQIDEETDPKEIMDLQARIQGEQASIQNEQTKIQLMAMLQKAEDGLISQQKKEVWNKAFGTGVSAMPSIGE